jgi:hypothetical protein
MTLFGNWLWSAPLYLKVFCIQFLNTHNEESIHYKKAKQYIIPNINNYHKARACNKRYIDLQYNSAANILI